MASFVEVEPNSAHHNGRPSHPLMALASHCVRINLGESPSRVVDALAAANPQEGWTWAQLMAQLRKIATSTTAVVISRTRTQRQRDEAHLRAAILVLWQHSIVRIRLPPSSAASATVATPSHSPTTTGAPPPLYSLDPYKAVYLAGPRSAQALAFIRKALDGTAAAVLETLLCRGKARTMDLIRYAVHHQQATQQRSSSSSSTHTQQQQSTVDNRNGVATNGSSSAQRPDTVASLATETCHTESATSHKSVVRALAQLVQGGFVQQVLPLRRSNEGESDQPDAGGPSDAPPHKKRKKEGSPAATANGNAPAPEKVASSTPVVASGDAMSEDPEIAAILQGNDLYRTVLPHDTVWRVHWDMLHASLRAVCLGRLVNEVHAHRVPSAGAFVTAALRYQAAVQYGSAAANQVRDHVTMDEDDEIFTVTGFWFKPVDIVDFLPKPIHQKLEAQSGGVVSNLRKTLKDLSDISADPRVFRRARFDSFQVCQTTLLKYWKTRVIHQLISDRHGAKAARIVSILLEKGWLEADTLAHYTMVPVKDTRAILHELYKSGYVEIFPLYTSPGGAPKQQNPSNAVYLWKVDESRLQTVARDHIALATLNMQLRRQCQVEQGRTYIERAQQNSDENENATDKLNYQKFSLGLERLDVALQHLDETLMVLSEFSRADLSHSA